MIITTLERAAKYINDLKIPNIKAEVYSLNVKIRVWLALPYNMNTAIIESKGDDFVYYKPDIEKCLDDLKGEENNYAIDEVFGEYDNFIVQELDIKTEKDFHKFDTIIKKGITENLNLYKILATAVKVHDLEDI